MPHARQQIREAAATVLTGLATSGSRVYQSRVHPLEAANLPCLLVNTDDEEVQGLKISSPDLLDRRLTLTVSAVAKASANLDDTLDNMIAEVETVLGGSILGGLVKTLQLDSIGIEMVQNDKPVGMARMSYSATYMTTANAPGVII